MFLGIGRFLAVFFLPGNCRPWDKCYARTLILFDGKHVPPAQPDGTMI